MILLVYAGMILKNMCRSEWFRIREKFKRRIHVRCTRRDKGRLFKMNLEEKELAEHGNARDRLALAEK